MTVTLMPPSSTTDGKVDREAVPLSTFLDRTGAVLRAGWPAAILVEATVVRVSANAGGYGLELVDPGPRGVQGGQLRAFLPATALPRIRRDLGVDFDPVHLTGLDALLKLAPAFDPRWHLQARVEGLGGAMRESLAARRLEAARTRLRQEGLFDRQRRLKCPADVTRLAIVHPPGSAGLADVAGEIAAWTAAGLIAARFVPAPFEGPQAAGRLSTALEDAVAPILGHPPDLVLLLRGGGARSGLLGLDDESLARTVATLPVPVITGLGHAIDKSLADAVAHAALDTPSKAIAFVRDCIHEPGRRVLAALTDIRRGASVQLAAAVSDEAAVRHRLIIGAERLLTAAEARCADRKATIRFEARNGRALIESLVTAVDRHHDAIRATWPQATVTAGLEIDRQLRGVHEAVRSSLARLPESGPIFAALQGRAATSLVGAMREADRLIAVIASTALRCLDRQDAVLRHAEQTLVDVDPAHRLGRGYVIVRDAAGHVLTTRRAAETAGSLVIEFADGVLAVTLCPPVSGPEG